MIVSNRCLGKSPWNETMDTLFKRDPAGRTTLPNGSIRFKFLPGPGSHSLWRDGFITDDEWLPTRLGGGFIQVFMRPSRFPNFGAWEFGVFLETCDYTPSVLKFEIQLVNKEDQQPIEKRVVFLSMDQPGMIDEFCLMSSVVVKEPAIAHKNVEVELTLFVCDPAGRTILPGGRLRFNFLPTATAVSLWRDGFLTEDEWLPTRFGSGFIQGFMRPSRFPNFGAWELSVFLETCALSRSALKCEIQLVRREDQQVIEKRVMFLSMDQPGVADEHCLMSSVLVAEPAIASAESIEVELIVSLANLPDPSGP
ncbi:hypothetical protein H9P43_007263 [Blastocladiella emersonii ATCC 22665]|nr:hypothetical protein H9P43_007263 [Blastocladiella emersonii ATCC 22665]